MLGLECAAEGGGGGPPKAPREDNSDKTQNPVTRGPKSQPELT